MKIRKKPMLITGAALLVIIAIAGFVYGRGDQQKNTPESESYYSLLTGQEVEKSVSEKPILGVMIENSPQARPQSGLGAAGFVFETVTEGGITRFIAFYQENEPNEITPIRSLRPAFLDWAMGFDASIAHVGGSAKALELVDKRDAKSLNQFQFPDPYTRSPDREPPHNMVANVSALRDLQNEQKHDSSDATKYPRLNSEQLTNDTPISKIRIDFSGDTYAVEYRYSAESEKYTRFLAGEPHVDLLTNKQITTDNVVIIESDSYTGGATGKGKAVIFRNGEAVMGEWRKPKPEDQLAFYDSEGREIALKRGVTWVAAVSSSGSYEFDK